MLWVSCREDFFEDFDHSEGNAFRDFPNLPDLGKFTNLTEAEFLSRIEGKRVVVLVHGYRNAAAKIAASYKKLEEMMAASNLLGGTGAYDMVVGYLWPGGVLRVGFPFSVGRANRSGKPFRALLAAMQTKAAAVDVETHSLGARVALKALLGVGVNIRNLLLTAPAVDDEAIQKGEEFFASYESTAKTYVYHSHGDDVLRFTYRAGDLLDFDQALGWEGPEDDESIRTFSKNARIVDCRDVVNDHSGYRDAIEFYDHWATEMKTPAPDQFVRLKKQPR
jgi:esterase/lipase superfamily enzyme